MEGEITFYTQRDLDAWQPRQRGEVDTTSPLGQLYEEWSDANRRSIREYDRRQEQTRQYERSTNARKRDQTWQAEVEADRQSLAGVHPPRQGV